MLKLRGRMIGHIVQYDRLLLHRPTLIKMGPEVWWVLLDIVKKSTRRVAVPDQTRLQEVFRDFFHCTIPTVYRVDMAHGLMSSSIED